MDITPQHQQPAHADDDLAKVLAGASDDPNEQPASPPTTPGEAAGLQFEEIPAPQQPVAPGSANVNAPAPEPPHEASPTPAPQLPTPEPTPAPTPEPEHQEPSTPPTPAPTSLPSAPASLPIGGASGGLDSLKKEALEELRPLIGNLHLPAEEMFDTLLLIIRSTDDQSLLQPAHEAAKNIQDEAKRAQALLDVIKEIDYFAGQGQPQ